MYIYIYILLCWVCLPSPQLKLAFFGCFLLKNKGAEASDGDFAPRKGLISANYLFCV